MPRSPRSDEAGGLAVCPECSKRIRVKSSSSGRQVCCPGCDHRFQFTPDEELLETLPARQSRRGTRQRNVSSGWAAHFLSIPMSLFVAVGLIIGMAILRIADYRIEGDIPFERLETQLTMGATVLLGLLSGLRLGWLWARLVSAFAIGLAIFGLVVFQKAGVLDNLFFIAFVFPMAMHLGILAALERPSAREFFRLKCPDCKSIRTGAADFCSNELNAAIVTAAGNCRHLATK